MQRTLSEQELHANDAYWRTANYLSSDRFILLRRIPRSLLRG